jgi:hypothetical protein
VTEIWKRCTRNAHYLISNLGRIKHLDRPQIREGIPNYFKTQPIVGMWDGQNSKSYSVALLVLEAFTDKPDSKSVVGHKDGNRFNTKLENLFWTDKGEILKQSHAKYKNWPLPKGANVCEQICVPKFHDFEKRMNKIPTPIELCEQPPIGADEAWRNVRAAWEVYVSIMGAACIDHGSENEEKKRRWDRSKLESFGDAADSVANA